MSLRFLVRSDSNLTIVLSVIFFFRNLNIVLDIGKVLASNDIGLARKLCRFFKNFHFNFFLSNITLISVSKYKNRDCFLNNFA